MTARQGCADPGYPISLSRIVPIADIAVSPTEDACRVDRTGDRFARPVHVVRVGYCDHRTQKRLARNTSPVRAFTADQLTFNHRNAETACPGPLGGILADRSGAEHYDIVSTVGCCHRGPFCRLM
jgi:hypothetical protein